MTPRQAPHHYEVLGRLMVALFDSGAPGIMEGSRGFNFWKTVGHGFAFEWDEGPHIHEVMQYLHELAADEEHRVLAPGDVVTSYDQRGFAEINVCDVCIQLRARDTLGHEHAYRKALQQIRKESARHH